MSKNNIHSMFVTLGASNHKYSEREQNDYYATDPKALELLLELENFDDNIWECACGEGHLSKVLQAHGYKVRSTDLIDRGFGETGVDFLTTQEEYNGDIVTNPPYKYAKEFAKHAIETITDGHRVAMFLKLQFLEGKARRELFNTYPQSLFMWRPEELIVVKTETSPKSREITIALRRMRGLYGKRVSKALLR